MENHEYQKLGPEQIIERYGKLLATGDRDGILGLYAAGAEIIPQGLQSLAGEEAIKDFYDGTFRAIRIEGDLKITSSIRTSDMSVVRCEEAAKVHDLIDGSSRESYFREIFVLVREDHQWKIAKYMFSENPGQAG